jgi:transposase InsO family protein
LKIRGAFIGGDTSEKSVAATAGYKGKGKERFQKFGKYSGDKRDAPQENEKGEGNKKRRTGGKGFKMCRCRTGPHPEEKCWYLHPDRASKEVQDAMKEGGKRLNVNKNVPNEAESPFNVSLYSTVQSDQTSCETPSVRRYHATMAKQNSTATSHSSEWIFDSGASVHMCNEIAAFINYTEFPKPREVELGDGYVIQTPGYGTVSLVSNQTEQTVLLSDVLHVPALQMNLISQRILDEKGCQTVIEHGIYTVSQNHVELLVGISHDKTLYTADVNVGKTGSPLNREPRCIALTTQKVQQSCDAPKAEVKRTLLDWHKVLGHTHLRNIKLLAKSADSGIIITGKSDTLTCEECILGKQHTRKGDGPGKPTTQPLELIHVDTDGPWQVGSFRQPGSIAPIPPGSVHYLALTDDYTGYVWTYFYKERSQFLTCVKHFKALVENQRKDNLKIQRFRMDGAKEFQSADVEMLFKSSGIAVKVSAAYRHQQNGKAERVNRTLIEMGRTMMVDAGLPESFWAEAIRTAVYLKNRLPSKSSPTGMLSAYEAYYGVRANLQHIHPFGCAAYAEIPRELRRKLLSQPKSRPGIFLGYVEGTTHQYRLYDINRKVIIVDRDVVFADGIRPAKQKTGQTTQAGGACNWFPEDQLPQVRDLQHLSMPKMVLDGGEEAAASLTYPNNNFLAEDGSVSASELVPEHEPNESDRVPGYEDQAFENLRRSSRLQDKPIKHWDFKKHGTDFANFASAEERFLGLKAQLKPQVAPGTDILIPTSAKQARASPHAPEWENAMRKDFTACKDFKTWDRIPYASITEKIRAKQHLRNRWVFRIKTEAGTDNIKFKARLVIKGYEQLYGEDFTETWASVATMTSFRILVAIAAQLGKKIYQMDVKNTFLNADLDETIFMQMPEGFDDGSGDILRLRRSLYGLKQAPRQWFRCIDEKLKSIGFQSAAADANVYLRKDCCILVLYVDDILYVLFAENVVVEIRSSLEGWFQMTWLGEAKRFLGVDIHYESDGTILLSQQRYIEEVLERFGMENCRPSQSPLAAGDKLVPIPPNASEPDPKEKLMYQRIIGSLMYAMVGTRPDIAFAVSATSQFAASPQHEHWVVLRHTLRYLRGSASLALRFPKEGNLSFKGYSDADWGGNIPNRRSTSGTAFILGGTAISWASKRQRSVALSSTEAEYMACSSSAQEGIWLRSLLKDIQNITLLGRETPLPSTLLLMDNQSAMALTKNPEYRKRTKHIDIAYHFVRERVATKELTVVYVPTEDMTADILTKGLSIAKHEKHVKGLGMVKEKGHSRDLGKF